MTDQSPKPKRRWFQISLRTLLAVVALAGALLLAWRVYVEPYRRQRDVMGVIDELGGLCETEPDGPAWIQRVFGAGNFQNVVLVDVADCDDPSAYLGQTGSLSRLETLVVGGDHFSDEHLSRLRRLTSLRWLVLDSTNVTDEAILGLRKALPDLVVHVSQRRTIALIEKGAAVKTELSRVNAKLRRIVSDEHFRDVTEIQIIASEDGDDILSHVGKCTKVRLLYLRSASVSDNGLARIKNLTNLRSLFLIDWQGSAAGLAHLAGLTDLQRLFLSDTSDAGLGHIRSLRNLVALGLHGTQVSGAGLRHIEELKRLEFLDLGYTQVGDTGLRYIKKLINLQELNLGGTRITDAHLIHLAQLTKLRVLDLHHTQTGDTGLAHLKGLTNITKLYLSSTKVSDAGLAHITNLTNLQQLWIQNTQVTDAGVKVLQSSLPNCQINY